MTGPAGLGSARPSGIGDFLVSSRTHDEYVAMFALTDRDLAGRLLDCPGGAAAFAATAGAVACDPAYALGRAELLRRADADRDRAAAYVDAHPDEYAWTHFAGPADYRHRRAAAGAAFAADLAAHPDRYVAAALPRLPFRDGTFDLVLCSHLLFSWADRLDLDFHEFAVAEMARVGRRVRIFPLFAMGATSALDRGPLLERLAARGITVEVRPVRYGFQRGEQAVLECTAC